MLFFVTSLTDFWGMAVTLWLAAYLLARGFPSRVTLRAVVVLLALAGFFLSGYLNLHHPAPSSTAWRAVCLTLAFLACHDLTYQLLPPPTQRRIRWVAWCVYASGLVAIALVIGERNIFVNPGNPLLAMQANIGVSYLAYGLFLVALAVATIYNFRLGTRSAQHRYFLAATVVAAGAAIMTYGAAALPMLPPLPRFPRDALLLVAVSLLGYSVARHQALVERRTTLQDLPVSGLAVLGLSGVYAFAAWQGDFPADVVAFITVLAILTHSAYGLVREFLDRLLHQRESALRRQLRELARAVGGHSALPNNLQQGLGVLCHTLRASGGFVAIRQEALFKVTASLKSVAVGSTLEAQAAACEDVCRAGGALAQRVVWLAPAFVGGDQIGVVGLGPRTGGGNYSEEDLDLLAETADWAGHLAHIHAQQQDSRERLIQLAGEVQSREVGLQAGAEDLLLALENNPHHEFIRLVEEGLRNLSDYAALGQSPLAEQLDAPGATHVERGKAVRQLLIEAIETLRPAAQRPTGILPREWHGHAILHDAYVEDAPNREITARLYISEGTFNRVRRKALRAVARTLWEMQSHPSAGRLARQPATTAAEME